MKKNLINKLLEVFSDSDDKNLEGFKAFDVGVEKLKKELKQKIQINTLEDVNSEIDKFRKRIDLDPIIEAVNGLKQELEDNDSTLRTQLEERLEELRDEISQSRGANKDTYTSVSREISSLEVALEELKNKKPIEIPDFGKDIKASEAKILELLSNVDKKTDTSKLDKKIEDEIKKLVEALDKLRIELVNRINERGGGSMNRQVLFNTTNYLKKYTDYNIIAGSNVSFTISENNTAKRVNLTISASGSGGGRVRLIQSVAINTVMGDAADTDYVYLVSGTTTMTLPTAVGNDNLYTIKNVGSGVVTIDTTGGETVDGNLTIVMPVQFTSVDLISDTVNWNVT